MSAGGIDVAGSVLAGLSTKRVTVSMVAAFPRNVGCRPTTRVLLRGTAAPVGGAAPAPAGYLSARSGMYLATLIRLEDASLDRLLRTGLPVGGSQQCEAPTFPVHGVLSGRERHVSPSIATFPHSEAAQLHPAERARSGFEHHLLIRQLTSGRALLIRDDRHGHNDFAFELGHGCLQDCRGPETAGSGWFEQVLRTPSNRGGTHGPESACVVTGWVHQYNHALSKSIVKITLC